MLKLSLCHFFTVTLAAIPFWVAIAQEKKDSPRFTLMDSEYTGISFSNEVRDLKEHNILRYANFYGGAGVGVGDFNNDGLQDLYFAGNMVPDKLYLNQGNLKFKDVTEQSGIKDDGGWSTGVTVADVNNDGHLDIYVSRELYDDKPKWRTNLLYINKGDGTFEESAKKFGVDNDQRTRHATFLDYDKDGWLDLFLLIQPPNPGSLSDYKGTTLLQEQYNLKFYRNLGDDKFEDVTASAGLDMVGFPNGVCAGDVNNDGWTDLYVANDFYAPDFLFINNQDGTFTNALENAMNHISYFSMGVDIADINNDNLLDIFVVDMVSEDNYRLKSNMSGMDRNSFWDVYNDGGYYQYMYNSLQLNNGNGTFSDVAQITGMEATDWSWSNLIADFDNDGLKDAFVTNGLLREIRNTDADKKVAEYIAKTRADWIKNHPDGGNLASIFDIIDLKKALEPIPSQPIKNYAFKNKGNLRFEKIREEWGLSQESFSNGAAYADFDNDGDLDLVVNNINEIAFVYRNNSESLGNSNYIRIKLKDKDHKSVFGAKVNVYLGNESQLGETTNVRGIYSTSEPHAHFGIGNHALVDSVSVLWPNGTKTLLYNVKANSVLELSMDEGKPYTIKDKEKVPIFSDGSEIVGLQYQHEENKFDDYDIQVLLPHKMSQFGPSLAKGDVNGDGLDDVFVGGATGFPASLFVQQSNGNFIKSDEILWDKEKPFEDVDALFVDINGDGHLDLYVVSGGNEYPVNDFRYVDRLYMNDGKGNFSKAAIPNIGRDSGSVVKASDYDMDGDIDLFVGGRLWPHQYPLPASSMLLQNNNGQLVNVTKQVAPELENLGMVTDAVWSDYDADGDLDLTLVGEWMPITIFNNENGRLSKVTANGLMESSGWWFSIEQGDFDHDGDMDYIAGNLGLNYKYKTSKEKPFDIYYNDFDGNEKYDIVLGYYNNDKHYPLRGFSCSSEQVPMLKEKFKKYNVFAALELDEVYGNQNLKSALHYTASTFASSYVENLGNGDFKIHQLPRMAQLTNINDILVKDFNEDGNLDALVVGNLFVSEIETPRNDAGTGALLLGDGQGTFKVLMGNESGFFNNADARKMTAMKILDRNFVIVANNDGPLKVFERNPK